MRSLALLVLLLVVAGCGGDSVGFYDDEAKELAKREATAKTRFGNVDKFTVESVRERRLRSGAISECGAVPGRRAQVPVYAAISTRYA